MSKGQRSCCVPCCKNEKFSLVHKFPADNERAEQWRKVLCIDSFIGLPIDIIRKRYYICSRHFRDADYKNQASRCINTTAVPSLNLVTLSDREGLKREIPPPNRVSLYDPPVGGTIILPVHTNGSGSNHMRPHETDVSPNTSTLCLELKDLLDETFTTVAPFENVVPEFLPLKKPVSDLGNQSSVIPAQRHPPPRTTSLKRPLPSQSTTEGQPRVKVERNATTVRATGPKPKPNNGVPRTSVASAPVDKKPLVLKRILGSSLMLERKRNSTTRTMMTQTDDNALESADNRTEPPAAGEEKDDTGKGATNSTKVLALLECTPENLQRLQRKLHDQGGALCLDERLFRLEGDEEEDEDDKAMSTGKANAFADKNRFLTVRNVKTDEIVSVSYVWLRDHCRCSECYNTVTFQRSTSILELPLDISASSCDIKDEQINIVWQDGHRSSYDLQQVFDNQIDTFRKRLEERRAQLVRWDRELITSAAPSYARVTLNDLLCEDDVMRQVVGSLVTYGFAFITKVPPNQQSTEMAVKRIFPVQRTLFGDMWTFSESKMDHSDTAYTNSFLGPHTDNTYFNDAAGLQVLHCIQFNGKGAETILVDGFRVAEQLHAVDPDAFQRLCDYPLEAEYIEEDKHHRYVAPVIKRHRMLPSPAIEQLRFNPYDRAPLRTLAHSDVPQFYTDYQRLATEIYREEEQWKFQLTPGTVLIFDNWRVLHGRTAYTGKRVMTGCYVARTEYQSVARTMGLIE